jgi:hypothetical protein
MARTVEDRIDHVREHHDAPNRDAEAQLLDDIQ